MKRRDFLITSTLGFTGALPALAKAGLAPVRFEADPTDRARSPQAPRLRNVTLEMSLKPFRDMREEAIEGVCRDVFRQWEPLTHDASVVSVLLWVADGSEILQYQGKLDESFDWARYLGMANPVLAVRHDPERKSLHSRPRLYMERPPTVTYRRLATIVRVLKRIGAEKSGKPVRVGATFDPGPEFAQSPFKYEWHPEIFLPDADQGGRPDVFLCCYSVLRGDRRNYAGFPDGIPDGTAFGTFFGRQSQHFLADLGFDYIWFSNGFGFGQETYKGAGPLFDGRAFDPAPARELRSKILGFWRLFRRECPSFPIETRGTNLLAGSDVATNGTPLREIYNGGFNLAPPPNSPWAAIDGDVGLEVAGYMTRIADLPPGKGFPFRFYTHDPWWLNTPWIDRYAREPFDIYLPASISRINARGTIETADSIELLTIDDSYGHRPDEVPNEVTPHLLAAFANAADHPAPLVWVYPLREYEEMVFGSEPRLAVPYFGDWFIRSAVNDGLPLSTVVASDNFLASRRARPGLYQESIIVAPVPDGGTPLEASFLEHAKSGGSLLLYGPVSHAGPRLLAALNLGQAEAIEGECALELVDQPDELTEAGYPKRLWHRSLFSAGGMEAVLADPSDHQTRVLAWAGEGARRRVAALSRECGEGRIAWVRGSNPNRFVAEGHLPATDDPARYFNGDLLLRFALGAFGYRLAVRKRTPVQKNPVLSFSRHANGFFLSSYNRDLTTDLKLRFPQGAPIFTNAETYLEEGAAVYRLPRSWHVECRVFLEQASGEVGCTVRTAEEIGLRRRLLVTGLRNAFVRFYPEGDAPVRFLHNPEDPYLAGEFLPAELRQGRFGRHYRVGPVSGPLLISW